MRILIPMSGFGERFKKAGYKIPKPLIPVEGRPMVQHVASLFVDEPEIDFICNERHLAETSFGMEQKLRNLPAKVSIHPIPQHKLGPVHAVLQVCDKIDPDEEVIVNYADFFCIWSYRDFLSDLRNRELDGCVPAYRGFHPHSGGATNYAYMRELNRELLEIREKQPFTKQKTEEFASTGTYYFKSAALMRTYFQRVISEEISVNGEFYASSAFDLMVKDNLKVGVYEVSHFMQWGTPEDLEEYVFWSNTFRQLSSGDRLGKAISGTGNLAVLASGKGSRFSSVGYEIPKPFLSVSGDSMLNQVLRVGGRSKRRAVSLTSNLLNHSDLNPEVEIVSFDKVTGGQAESANNLLGELSDWENAPFTILPSDTIFSDNSLALGRIREELCGEAFMVIWACKPSPYALRNPSSFGWVSSNEQGMKTFIKTAPKIEGALMISGAFTFSSKHDFSMLFDALTNKGMKVNGELYLDSAIEIAKEQGFKVMIFEPEFCLSLGTPEEFETFRYWQTAFDQWQGHPYGLELDPFVRPENIESVRESLLATKHRPTEWVPK